MAKDKRIQDLMTLGFTDIHSSSECVYSLVYKFKNRADYRAHAKEIRAKVKEIMGTSRQTMSAPNARDPVTLAPISYVSVTVHTKTPMKIEGSSQAKALPALRRSAAPALSPNERAVYDDYLYSGNHNFWSDRARAQSVSRTGGMSQSDYEYAGYTDAYNQVSRDRALVRQFYG